MIVASNIQRYQLYATHRMVSKHKISLSSSVVQLIVASKRPDSGTEPIVTVVTLVCGPTATGQGMSVVFKSASSADSHNRIKHSMSAEKSRGHKPDLCTNQWSCLAPRRHSGSHMLYPCH